MWVNFLSMEIVLATNNMDKLREIRDIFGSNISGDGSINKIILPGDLNVDYSYEETGSTLLENAMGKAMHLYTLLIEKGIEEKAVLADDSGLFVDALNGEPGIKSARYGAKGDGARLSDSERNRYLLQKLGGESNRKAHFLCCMVLVVDRDRFVVAQEKFEGEIIDSPRGENGFGYDPLFFLPDYGKTVAELGDELKNRISHRARAAGIILNVIRALDL